MDEIKGYYFHCVACDQTLDEFQQKTGVCTVCKSIIKQTNHPVDRAQSEHDIYRMWNPPMGDINEFFQDVENEYNGGSSE